MKGDVKSNYNVSSADVGGTGTTTFSNVVDHSLYATASFQLEALTVGTSVDMKVQHSPDNSTWTDDDGASGNDTAITQLVAPGRDILHVVNPQARYSRVACTLVGACTGVVADVAGPKRHSDVL